MKNIYLEKVTKDTLDDIFLTIDTSELPTDDLIELVVDRFNNLYNEEDEIHISGDTVSRNIVEMLVELHTNDKYYDYRYQKLKVFITKEYLSTYRTSWVYKVDNKIIKLVRNMHDFIGQGFIDNVLIDIDLHNNYADLISSVNIILGLLQMTSDNINFQRLCKDLIQNCTTSYSKCDIHYYMYLFYKLRDIGDNFEKILKIFAPVVMSSKKYFNSESYIDVIDRHNIVTAEGLLELYDYLYNQGYISKKDITFVQKAVIDHSI